MRSSKAFARLSWVAAALAAAAVAAAQDRVIALGVERWGLPLALGLVQAGVGALVLLVLRTHRRRVGGALLGLACAGLWAQAWPGWTSESTGRAPGPLVVLLTLDTFRADYLGAQGGPVPTPALDALAASGALFTSAITEIPLTAPSHATMLTGLPPWQHGLRANGGQLGDAPTVVPALRESGRRTGAFLSARILDRRTGLGQGFDHYEDRWGWGQRLGWLPFGPRLPQEGLTRAGDETVARALHWLREDDRPAFLWVHLYDPHTPYLPPPAFRPSAAERAAASATDRAQREPSSSIREFADHLEAGVVEGQRLMYGAEIRWTDAVVGSLLAGLPADAIVVACGDHGEGLGEHGVYFNHGGDLYEPALRVPLIVRWPGRIAPGTRTNSLVSLARVAPTLLRAAGLAHEQPDLIDALAGPGDPSVTAYTPGQEAHRPLGQPDPLGPLAALRLPTAKLIVGGEGPIWYDLQSDPDEANPQPPTLEQSDGLPALEALQQTPRPAVDGEQAEMLRALGYVQGVGP